MGPGMVTYSAAVDKAEKASSLLGPCSSLWACSRQPETWLFVSFAAERCCDTVTGGAIYLVGRKLTSSASAVVSFSCLVCWSAGLSGDLCMPQV